MRLPVLMYHSVGGPLPERLAELSVPAARLEEQLAALQADGWLLRGLTESLRLHEAGERVVALTFDDGYVDYLHTALPLLERYAARSTLYVPTRDLGGRASWLADGGHLALLDGQQVAEVAARGQEVGSHGARHEPMDVLPRPLAAAWLRESRRALAEVTGRPVVSFCYPHGYHSRRLREEVRRAGYLNACTIGHRTSPPGEDRWALSRLLVGPDHDAEAVVAMVRGAGPRGVLPPLKRLVAPGWRATRRAVRTTTGRTWT